jgi:hypothetical protein
MLVRRFMNCGMQGGARDEVGDLGVRHVLQKWSHEIPPDLRHRVSLWQGLTCRARKLLGERAVQRRRYAMFPHDSDDDDAKETA